jgi:hypothetical protein
MAERQQKLLANRITGTPRLSEQAIDDEKPPSLLGLTPQVGFTRLAARSNSGSSEFL